MLAGEVAPGRVGGEEDAVVPDATTLDLLDQPGRREADRPAGVGVDLHPGLDPVEEPAADELHVAAHPAAEVHEMETYVPGVALHERADLVDVGGGAGRGVHVHGQ